MESSSMRTFYPERSRILNERRKQHPRDEELNSYYDWEGHAWPDQNASKSAEGNTRNLRVPSEKERQEEMLRSKGLASRRSAGGKLFSSGGGGEGGCAFQVL